MIFITEKSVLQNMKKFGFRSYDANILQLVNQYFENFVRNTLTKASKKTDYVEAKQILQAGGKIVLPSEYFGVESGSYFDNLKSYGTDMSVKEAFIRPTVATYDLSGAIKTGGSSQLFSVSKRSVQNAIKEALVSLQRNIKVKSDAALALQQGFQSVMTEILQKASKKNDSHLTEDTIKQLSNQRKYHLLSD